MRGAASCELVRHAVSVRDGGSARTQPRHLAGREEEEEAPVFEPGFDIGSSDAAPAIHGI